MRVCRVVGNYPRIEGLKGPAEVYLGPNVYCISMAQLALGLDVTVVTRREGGLPKSEDVLGVRVERVERPFNLNAARRILALHRRRPFDVLHVHAASCFSPAFIRRIWRKVPLVSHVHGTTAGAEAAMSPGRRGTGGPEAARERFLWRRSDAVVAVSRATASEVVSFYGVSPDVVHTAYNGVDVELFCPSKSVGAASDLFDGFLRDGDRIVLFVGQIGPRKGLEELAQAAAIVSDENDDVKFVLAGGSPPYAGEAGRRYFHGLRAGLGSERFVFLGPVPHFKLPALYRAARVFAFPSLYEGFPKAILEAMACKTPVVSSCVGGIPEMIRQGTEGLLVEPRRPDQLAFAICALLDDRTGALRMGSRGRSRVARFFTWKRTAEKLSQVYELAQSRARATSRRI